MTITLYNNVSDNRKLNKIIDMKGSEVIALLETSSIENPIFILENRTINFNYLYVSDFNKYYYISDIILMQGGKIKLFCEVDVLMTYASQIKATRQLILRQENIKSNYITDDRLLLKKDKLQKLIKFKYSNLNFDQSTATGYNFLLTVSGGTGSVIEKVT